MGLTCEIGNLCLNRQELAARDSSIAESSKNGGILYVFPGFGTERIGEKIRCPAGDDLFRDSIVFSGNAFPFGEGGSPKG